MSAKQLLAALAWIGGLVSASGCGNAAVAASTSSASSTGSSGMLVVPPGGSSTTLSAAGASSSGAGSASASSGSGGSSASSAALGSSSGNSTAAADDAGLDGGSLGDGGPDDGGPFADDCDAITLTWNGPTSTENGECLTNLGGFQVQWGTVSGGPYPNVIDVGLPCAPGAQAACGDGGFADQLDCSYTLAGLTNGTWFVTVVAVNTQGVTSAPSGQASGTIDCACDGCVCSTGNDCPPFQTCDPATGQCDTGCTGASCGCVADTQCAGGDAGQAGLGQGEICVEGFCAPGCNGATDCPADQACDLDGGPPGNCVGGCAGTACACAIDTQCSAGEPGQVSVCGTDGWCTPGCKTGYDCPPDAACDLSGGFIGACATACADESCSCVSDSQCADGGCDPSNGLCGPG